MLLNEVRSRLCALGFKPQGRNHIRRSLPGGVDVTVHFQQMEGARLSPTVSFGALKYAKIAGQKLKSSFGFEIEVESISFYGFSLKKFMDQYSSYYDNYMDLYYIDIYKDAQIFCDAFYDSEFSKIFHCACLIDAVRAVSGGVFSSGGGYLFLASMVAAESGCSDLRNELYRYVDKSGSKLEKDFLQEFVP